MSLSYQRIEPSEAKVLADFISGDTWPFMFHSAPSWESVIAHIADGRFFGGGCESYWIRKDESNIGLIEITRLNEVAPQFTFRLRTENRDQGLGRPVLEWLTAYIFEKYPFKRRIEAKTREDHVAMRKVLASCGYVKEAYYRKTTPIDDGEFRASIGYGILREDWQSKGVTSVKWSDDAFFPHDL